MVRYIKKNSLILSFCVVTGCIWAFSLAVHFLDYFELSKMTKIISYFSLAPIFWILVFFLLYSFVLKQISSYRLILRGLIILLSLAMTSVFFLSDYEKAPIFTQHTLTIRPESLNAGQYLEIREIYFSDKGRSAALPPTELTFFGEWEIDGNSFHTTDSNANLSYQFEGMDGISVVFRSNPSSGKARIVWDDAAQIIDTFEFVNTENEIILPANSRGKPDITWEVLGIVSIIADFFSLFCAHILGFILLIMVLDFLKKLNILLLFIASGLMLLNFSSIFLSMRSPELKNQIWDESQVLDVIQQQTSSRQERFESLTNAIHHGVASYWDDDDLKRYNLRVPLYENYVLFLQRWHLEPQYHRKYEFVDYARALERGVGICSQKSIMLFDILQKENIPAKVIGFPGHIVVTAQLDEQHWWILDADYGVIIHHDLTSVYENPELIRPDYRAAGYNDTTIDHLITIIQSGKITPYNNMEAYFDRDYVQNEYRAYIMVWVYPFLLVLPFLFSRAKKFLIKADQ